jgi:hypothetical protein
MLGLGIPPICGDCIAEADPPNADDCPAELDELELELLDEPPACPPAICPRVLLRLPLAPLAPAVPPVALRLSDNTVGLDEPLFDDPPATPLREDGPPCAVACPLFTTRPPAKPLGLAGAFRPSVLGLADESPATSELPVPEAPWLLAFGVFVAELLPPELLPLELFPLEAAIR